MGLNFENFIPIHQAHSHCRELCYRCARMCWTIPTENHLMNCGPRSVLSGTERESAVINSGRLPVGHDRQWGDTPVQSQSECDGVFQREAVAGNESSRQRTCRGGEIPVELVCRQPSDDFLIAGRGVEDK